MGTVDLVPEDVAQTRADLERAITVMRERGWCKSDYEDEQGHVCMIGALRVAITNRARRPLNIPHDHRLNAAYTALARTVEVYTSKEYVNPEHYNDAAGVKQEDVEAIFEKTIANL